MTVYRVNVDRDEAEIVNFDRNRYLKYHTVTGKDCLSSISKHYYKAFTYWPMIWLDNYNIFFDNPNKLYQRQKLLIRRPDRISLDDRIDSVILFDCWDDEPAVRAKRVAEAIARIEHRAKVKRLANGGQGQAMP